MQRTQKNSDLILNGLEWDLTGANVLARMPSSCSFHMRNMISLCSPIQPVTETEKRVKIKRKKHIDAQILKWLL
jgi:hypothetical protein